MQRNKEMIGCVGGRERERERKRERERETMITLVLLVFACKSKCEKVLSMQMWRHVTGLH